MANDGSNQPTRIYNDGPCFTNTSLAVEAEKAYRHWFAQTADGVPKWTQQENGYKSLNIDDVRWAVVYGVSGNPRRFWDLEHARELLGWEPQDAAPV